MSKDLRSLDPRPWLRLHLSIFFWCEILDVDKDIVSSGVMWPLFSVLDWSLSSYYYYVLFLFIELPLIF